MRLYILPQAGASALISDPLSLTINSILNILHTNNLTLKESL